MKKSLILIPLSLLSFQAQGAEMAGVFFGSCVFTVASSVMRSCVTSCCVPSLRCCMKSTTDVLDQYCPPPQTSNNDHEKDTPKDNTLDILQKIIPNEDLREIIINNGMATNNHYYYHVVYTPPTPPAGVHAPTLKKKHIHSPKHHPNSPPALRKLSPQLLESNSSARLFARFKDAVKKVDPDGLQTFTQGPASLKGVEDVIDLNWGKHIHAYVFNNRKNHALTILEPLKLVDEEVFDGLFLASQQDAKQSMRQLARVLNKAAASSSTPLGSKPKLYPDGLYLSTCGTTFYKFHHTYIVPLPSGQVLPGFELRPAFSFGLERNPSSLTQEESKDQEDVLKLQHPWSTLPSPRSPNSAMTGDDELGV